MANNDQGMQQITDIINKVKEQGTNANNTITEQDKKIKGASKKIQNLLKELYNFDVSLQEETSNVMQLESQTPPQQYINDLQHYVFIIRHELISILGNLQKN